MQIVDAHHHLWDLSACTYPWLESEDTDGGFVGNISALQQTYSLDDYRADIGQLDIIKSVHVQAEHDPADPVAETIWLQAQADHEASGGFPHAIVAFADFSKGDTADTLARHASYKNVRGIRQILSHHWNPAFCHAEHEYLKNENWCTRIALLKSHSLSFDLQIYPHQVTDALPVIDANPETLFIINHALEPWSTSEDVLSCWREGVAQLSQRDNTAMKISGFGMFLRPIRDAVIRPYIIELIEAFGANRCMFASNFPVDKLFCTYDETFSAFDRITQEFSDMERAALFVGNAERAYRI